MKNRPPKRDVDGDKSHIKRAYEARWCENSADTSEQWRRGRVFEKPQAAISISEISKMANQTWLLSVLNAFFFFGGGGCFSWLHPTHF